MCALRAGQALVKILLRSGKMARLQRHLLFQAEVVTQAGPHFAALLLRQRDDAGNQPLKLSTLL